MPQGTTLLEVMTLFVPAYTEIIDRGNEKLASSFDNFDIQLVSVDFTNPSLDRWVIYPKIIIKGDWTAPNQTVDNRFDDYFTSLKGIYRSVIQPAGATDAQIHYHPMLSNFNEGSIDEAL